MFYWFIGMDFSSMADIAIWLNGLVGHEIRDIKEGNKKLGCVVEVLDYKVISKYESRDAEEDDFYYVIAYCQCRRYKEEKR